MSLTTMSVSTTFWVYSMKMYRVMSQTKSGYPDSHGYYLSKNEANQIVNELASYYVNRNTKFWIREVN